MGKLEWARIEIWKLFWKMEASTKKEKIIKIFNFPLF
jgi:hypothetical protein